MTGLFIFFGFMLGICVLILINKKIKCINCLCKKCINKACPKSQCDLCKNYFFAEAKECTKLKTKDIK